LNCYAFDNRENQNIPNGAMDRITMPAALLSLILLSQGPRQKQVVKSHRGHWEKET
jgi:hypothetical protein